jgi:TrmH family RNA methyltransferase
MALEGGHTPLDVFYCEAHFAGETAPAILQKLLERGGQPHPVSSKVMRSLSERDAPQGIIATFPLFETSIDIFFTAIKTPPALFVVLDRLQDPGNLGTLIRTADAIAANGVVLIEPCVDPFELKTVRGSMGSIFNLPLVHITDPLTIFTTLAELGYKLTGADGYRGDFPWEVQNKALDGSVALFLGNEARGLNEDIRPHLTHWVRLPLLGRAESLNVAVAGGVLMYYWLERNRSGD